MKNMKIRRATAAVIAGICLLSTPVCAATSPTASGSSAIDELAKANGTTKEAVEELVKNGTYANETDALYHGNITAPSDVAANGGAATWQAVQAEKKALVNGQPVAILESEMPVKLDEAVNGSANGHASANGNAIINKGSIGLQSFFSRYANSEVTYPLLINGGRYTYREGDMFFLYNYLTKSWELFPVAGFRTGHYDIRFPAGMNRSAYLNKSGRLSYLIECKKGVAR